MDVDEDFDAALLRNFSCMGTTDKEVLVKQLQALVGGDVNQQTACFYLDMTNWNVQAAVCAYFDMEASARLPKMSMIRDDTIGEGESIPPLTKFCKSWIVRNDGLERWPLQCKLVCTSGDRLGAPEFLDVESLNPGESRKISIEMVSPSVTGTYFSTWRMSTNNGCYFGDPIWVIQNVDSGGTLALLQQMENFRDFGSSERQTEPSNPFSLGTDPPSQVPIDNTNNNINNDTEMS